MLFGITLLEDLNPLLRYLFLSYRKSEIFWDCLQIFIGSIPRLSFLEKVKKEKKYGAEILKKSQRIQKIMGLWKISGKNKKKGEFLKTSSHMFLIRKNLKKNHLKINSRKKNNWNKKAH